MKREDLEKLGLTKEQIDAVMAENGKDIESQKAKLTSIEVDAKTARDQLAEANKQIEDFKKMDVDGIKKAADEWKVKYDQTIEKHANEEKQRLFDTALESGLKAAKAKNPLAVKGLLDLNGLKYNEADKSLIGLKEQIEKIKPENDYLFESTEQTPKIVTGGNNQTITTDAFTAALRKGAGLPEGK